MEEKKPEEDIIHLRDLAISLMARRFGEPQKTEKRIKFKDYTDRKIGEILGYDKSHIFRLLKNPALLERQPLSTEAMKNIIIRVTTLDYNDASEIHMPQWQEQSEELKQLHETNQTTKRRFVLSLIGLVILSLFLVFFVSRSSRERNRLNDEVVQLKDEVAYLKDRLVYAQNHYILNDIEEVEDAIFTISSSNIPRLEVEAALFNMDLKNLKTTTREDSIALVGIIKSTTTRVLGDTRFESIYHKFVTKEGTKLTDLIDGTVPRDSMYACSDSLLAFVKARDLPEYATLFDRGLALAIPYLLSREKKLDIVMKHAGEQVDKVQKIQVSMISDLLRKEEGY